MRAPAIGVIMQEDITRMDVISECLRDLRGRIRDGEDVYGIVGIALRDEAAVGRNKGTGEVMITLARISFTTATRDSRISSSRPNSCMPHLYPVKLSNRYDVIIHASGQLQLRTGCPTSGAHPPEGINEPGSGRHTSDSSDAMTRDRLRSAPTKHPRLRLEVSGWSRDRGEDGRR
jgi:hypothetical protein